MFAHMDIIHFHWKVRLSFSCLYRDYYVVKFSCFIGSLGDY